MCIDYRKLNAATHKDHFSLLFIDQILERIVGHPFYCFLDDYYGYLQIEIALEDLDKTTFMCPFGTYAFRRMPFRLCNAPATFQRCMISIFSNMVEKCMEVFMDDLTVFGNSFDMCLLNLEAVLTRCEEKGLVLNWEKCYFMIPNGIVLGHIVSEGGIELINLILISCLNCPPLKWSKTLGLFLGMLTFIAGSVRTFQRFPDRCANFWPKMSCSHRHKSVKNPSKHLR